MSSKEYVINTIASIVDVDPEKINEETKLIDIAHDSIKLFELFIRLEKELQGTLTYEDVSHVESVGDVIHFISKRSLALSSHVEVC